MSAWNDDRFAPLYRAGDPHADAFVAAEAEAGRLPALYAWLADRAPPGPALAAWLATVGLPEDLDRERLRRGQGVYARHAPQVMLGLLCKGLPESYASPRGAAQLLIAGRFAREPRARLMETARLLAGVMYPGTFDGPEPAALQEIRKVRLVHAVARRYIAAHPDYDPTGGAPINQEYMVGTLLAFSSLVLDAVGDLGVALTAAEEADYYYVWQVVGPLIGVRDVPESVADARACFAEIRRRQHGPSPAGKVLTDALLGMLAELIPGERLDEVPMALVWHLSGPAVATWLGLERPRAVEARLVQALRCFGRATDAAGDAVPLLARLSEPLGLAVYDAVWKYGSQGVRPTYRPPG